MAQRRVFIGGSWMNPVHTAHKDLCSAFIRSGLCDYLIFRPDGFRPDKGKNLATPQARSTMIQLMFPDQMFINPLCRFCIDQSDLWREQFTPTIEVLRKWKRDHPNDNVSWFTGVDSVISREEFDGKCEVEACWEEGEELMREWQFVIVPRATYAHPSTLSLPSQFRIADFHLADIASRKIIEEIAKGGAGWHAYYGGSTHPIVQLIIQDGLYGYKGESK